MIALQHHRALLAVLRKIQFRAIAVKSRFVFSRNFVLRYLFGVPAVDIVHAEQIPPVVLLAQIKDMALRAFEQIPLDNACRLVVRRFHVRVLFGRLVDSSTVWDRRSKLILCAAAKRNTPYFTAYPFIKVVFVALDTRRFIGHFIQLGDKRTVLRLPVFHRDVLPLYRGVGRKQHEVERGETRRADTA